MRQIEENKHELWEMMEQRSMAPLTTDSVSDLAVLMGAYNAVCMVCDAHKNAEPAESAHASVRPRTAGWGAL